jgi:hypothetical protein
MSVYRIKLGHTYRSARTYILISSPTLISPNGFLGSVVFVYGGNETSTFEPYIQSLLTCFAYRILLV